MSINHWMSFSTFAEQRYFEYPVSDAYFGVLINANMVAHAPAGLAAFLLEKTSGKRYLVDPLTHAFQHDPSLITGKDGETKSSIKVLSESFGSPISEIVGQRSLRPNDLKGAVVTEFVQRVLDFQATSLKTEMEQSELMKYLDENDVQLHPCALVAPYFFITEVRLEEWLEVNVHCITEAAKLRTAYPRSKLYGAVVLSKGVLSNPSRLERVVSAFKELPVDGFLLWIDDFNEHDASSLELSSFLSLTSQLRGQNNEREVINKHGGYFSILAASPLGKSALTGVCHGPEFGEYRGVVPVGGGIPIAKYYIPKLHTRMRYRDAVRVFTEAKWLNSAEVFHKQVCDCDACRGVIASDTANFTLYGDDTVKTVRRGKGLVRIGFPTSATKLRCLEHYLQCKHREFQTASNAPSDVLVKNLEDGIDTFESVCGTDAIAHLALWKEALGC